MEKHARNIWKAWADGKTVQFRYDAKNHHPLKDKRFFWADSDPSTKGIHDLPQNDPERWRIKSEADTKQFSIRYRVALLSTDKKNKNIQAIALRPDQYDEKEKSDEFICWIGRDEEVQVVMDQETVKTAAEIKNNVKDPLESLPQVIKDIDKVIEEIDPNDIDDKMIPLMEMLGRIDADIMDIDHFLEWSDECQYRSYDELFATAKQWHYDRIKQIESLYPDDDYTYDDE